jgi:hypothetical protein
MIDKSLRSRYQWGGPGGKSPGGSGRGGSGGGAGAGRGRDPAPAPAPSPHRDPAPAPAPAPAPSPHRDDSAERAAQAVADRLNAQRAEAERANQLAEARRLMTQPTTVDVPIKGPELIPGTTGPVKLDPYQQNYISPGRVDIKDRYQTGDYDDLVQGPIDVGFQNILRKQEIAEGLRQKQQDPDYGQFFRPQPVVEQPSGIMSKIGGIGKKVFGETPLDVALTLGTMGGSKLAGGIKMAQRYLPKQFGDIKTALTSKFKAPGTGTQKEATKELVKHEPVDRDGQQTTTVQEAVAGKKSLGIDFEDIRKKQSIMTTALDEGWYLDNEGRRIQLTDQQKEMLTAYITRIDKYLVDPRAMSAYGGRIDKALGGRSRDIG